METSPAPCPAQLSRRSPESGISARDSAGLSRAPVPGPGPSPPPMEPGQGRNGTAPHGQAPAAGLGRSPAPDSEGTGSASLLPTEICRSVGHRAWSVALTGCQAISLRILRELLVLEGKVLPLPLVKHAQHP